MKPVPTVSPLTERTIFLVILGICVGVVAEFGWFLYVIGSLD